MKVIKKATNEEWTLLIKNDNIKNYCILKELGLQQFFELLQKAAKSELIDLKQDSCKDQHLGLQVDFKSFGFLKHIFKLKKESTR